MPPAPSRGEYVTIDGFPIPCLCIEIVSGLQELWRPPDKRGTNVDIPHRDGSKSRRRRSTGSRRQLQLIVNGSYDLTDVASSDPRATLEVNLAGIQAAIYDHPGGDGTRTAVVHLPGGGTRTGPITVETFEWAPYTPIEVRAVLELTIPAGQLVRTVTAAGAQTFAALTQHAVGTFA